MKKGDIIKLIGFLLIPVVLFVVVFFFLYPYINEQDYQDIVDSNKGEYGVPIENEPVYMDADGTIRATQDTLIVRDTTLTNELEMLKAENFRLNFVIDSLQTEVNNQLAIADSLMALPLQAPDEIEVIGEERFNEMVKSLLNLEDDELSPILQKFNNKQLVKLYKNGGSRQREKILRALNADRAARLMTEVML